MRTLVIIDPQIAEMETLAAGLAPDQEVLILNAKEDGVEQIARYLSGKSGYDAIHLLSHGGAGSVQLGRTLLTEDLLPANSRTRFACVSRSYCSPRCSRDAVVHSRARKS